MIQPLKQCRCGGQISEKSMFLKGKRIKRRECDKCRRVQEIRTRPITEATP